MNLNHRVTKLIYLLISLIISTPSLADSDQKVIIFAAASLTNVIDEIVVNYEKESEIKVQPSYASSSTLAKQIEHGAPADLFISADAKWMHYLKEKNALKQNTIKNLLNNTLAIIAPKGNAFKAEMSPSFKFDDAFTGRLCTGETESVPAGIYAKQALKSLNWWDKIKSRIVGARDVRAALVLVERGECAAGIVYATDAKTSDKVEVIATFPKGSHEAIVYPLGLTNHATLKALDFYNYLQSEQAKVLFIKHGFSSIKQSY